MGPASSNQKAAIACLAAVVPRCATSAEFLSMAMTISASILDLQEPLAKNVPGAPSGPTPL